MILSKTSPVIPTHVLWLAILFLIGIFGLTSQVRSSLSHLLSSMAHRKTVKTLLVMGFQRETASRCALAIYTSVCLLHHGSFKCLNYSRLSLLWCLSSSFFIRCLLHYQLLEQP